MNGAAPARRSRALLLTLVVLALVVSVSACGRKGAPEAPPGSTYPQQYPQY